MRNFPPILITSAVKVSAPISKLRNQEIRINLTLKAIEKWLLIDKTMRIVICDGSGVDFSKKIHSYFPSSKIEFLHFENNGSLVAKYGSGYGEGEIIKYALSHSSILKNTPIFAKCTSKLNVNNFKKIAKNFNGSFICQCTFSNIRLIRSFFDYRSVRKIELLGIDTRFYIVKKDIYIKIFQNAYKDVRHEKKYYLEHAFYTAANDGKLKNFIADFPFLINGVSGTLNIEYRKIGILRYSKSLLNFRLLKRISLYKNLFI